MSHPNIPEPDMNWAIIRAVVVVGIVLFLVSSCLSSVHHAAHPDPNPVYQWERDRIANGAAAMSLIFIVITIVVVLVAGLYLKETFDTTQRASDEQRSEHARRLADQRQQAENQRRYAVEAEQAQRQHAREQERRVEDLRRQIAELEAREREAAAKFRAVR